MFGGGDPFYLKFWVKLPCWSEMADFQSIFARSASAVTSSRGVHDRGIPMGPMGIPWESHVNGKHRLNSWEWEQEWE